MQRYLWRSGYYRV